jgi:hypothetical protein
VRLRQPLAVLARSTTEPWKEGHPFHSSFHHPNDIFGTVTLHAYDVYSEYATRHLHRCRDAVCCHNITRRNVTRVEQQLRAAASTQFSHHREAQACKAKMKKVRHATCSRDQQALWLIPPRSQTWSSGVYGANLVFKQHLEACCMYT